MKITIDNDDLPKMKQIFGDTVTEEGNETLTAERLAATLSVARQAQHSDRDIGWRRHLLFLMLFIFLYAVLGASLTLDFSSAAFVHLSIVYAMQAIPVLVAFSGFVVSILFLFSARSHALRSQNWLDTIELLEKYQGNQLMAYFRQQNHSARNYSQANIIVALAGFICLTWIVMYNYLTFTTSGVIGSVISLFITTMVYVILDIQLLKSDQPVVEPSGSLPPRKKKQKKGQTESDVDDGQVADSQPATDETSTR